MATNNAINVNSGSPLSLLNGGMSASLSASNGGIFYSTASAGAILSGTSTARQMLQSGASTTPAWSTATYPATTTINRILYSSAANVISEIITANSSIMITSSGGAPSFSTTLPAFTTPSITFSNTSTGGIVGTTTNDMAATGYVGEIVTSNIATGSAVSLTTATAKTITSISLTAGDWDVRGVITTKPAAGTTTSAYTAAISLADNTVPTLAPDATVTTLSGITIASNGIVGLSTGVERLSLSATTTVYLVAQVSFAVSTMAAFGFVSARRAR